MISEGQKREALACLLNSSELRGKERLRQFLSYIVKAELSGRAAGLKAYSIAVDVYDRESDFDPQSNSLVRTEATRLRQAIARHYAGEGAIEPLRIVLGPGSYIPTYALAPSKVANVPRPIWIKASLIVTPLIVAGALYWGWHTRALPSSIVNEANLLLPRVETQKLQFLPHQPENADLDVRTIADLLTTRLARFDDIVAFDGLSETTSDYSITPILLVDKDKKTLELRLSQTATKRLIWSSSFSFTILDRNRIDEMLSRAASSIGQPYGAIYSDLRNNGASPEMKCVIDSFEFFRRIELTALEPTVRCLEDVVSRKPKFYTALTALSRLSIFKFQITNGVESQEALRRAAAYAERAIEVAPERARVWKTIFEVRFFQKRFDEAFAAADRALALNPDAADILFRIGAAHIARGRVAEGTATIRRAQVLNGATPNWVRGYLLIAAILDGNIANSKDAVFGYVPDDFPLTLVALALHEIEMDTEVISASKDRLRAFYPTLMADVPALFDRFALSEEVQARLLKR